MPGFESLRVIEPLLLKAEESGATLEEKATALSELIEQVNKRLANMPGKIPVSVEDGETLLFFGKTGKSWGLWLRDKFCDRGMDGELTLEAFTGVGIPRKASAFHLLPKLLEKLGDVQRRTVVQIDKAFEALKKMEGE